MTQAPRLFCRGSWTGACRTADGPARTDVLGLAMLGGIGLTVCLLIGELTFGTGSESDDHVKAAVLLGSLAAALPATVVLRMRNRPCRRL